MTAVLRPPVQKVVYKPLLGLPQIEMRGLAIIKANGVWSTSLTVTQDQMALHTADRCYVGGYEYTLTQDEVDDLTAGGFAQYISDSSNPAPNPPPVVTPGDTPYGYSTYGTGDYGGH